MLSTNSGKHFETRQNRGPENVNSIRLEHIISCGVKGASGPCTCRVVGQHLFLAGENAWIDPFGVTSGRNPVGDRGTKGAHSGRPPLRVITRGRSSGHFLRVVIRWRGALDLRPEDAGTNGFNQPVLKHGPRSLTHMRVVRWQTLDAQ